MLHPQRKRKPLALLARIGIGMSIIFSYPLIFVALRDATQELFGLNGAKQSVHYASTLLLLCAVNGVALVLKDLGLVVSVGGAALMGAAWWWRSTRKPVARQGWFR